jgi:hypothetical protein
LFATAAPLHRISAKGSRNKRTARRNAILDGIFVPNKPVEDVEEDTGTVACVSCVGSIAVNFVIKR